MKLRKFPVFSDTGNEYAVTLYKPEYFYGMAAKVYVRESRLFGLLKWRKVAGGGLTGTVAFGTEDWGYDYKAMAKRAVNCYEEEQADKFQRTIDKQDGLREFEKWDGR